MNQQQVAVHCSGARCKQAAWLFASLWVIGKEFWSCRRTRVINYCVYTYVNNSYFACIKVITAYGGDRWATPWTNMHNNSANMILVIHGAPTEPRHIPTYSRVHRWDRTPCLQTAHHWFVWKWLRVSSYFKCLWELFLEIKTLENIFADIWWIAQWRAWEQS